MRLGGSITACLFGITAPFAANGQGLDAYPERSLTCEAGDLGYLVTRAVGDGSFGTPQFVIVTPASSEMVGLSELQPPFVLPHDQYGEYVGPEGRFSLGGKRLDFSDGLSLDCEPLAASPPPADSNFGPNSVSERDALPAETLNTPGVSYGGRLRARPSMDGAPIGSLADGSHVTVLRDTGVWMNGYSWFELARSGHALGYQWGGILCVEDGPGGTRPGSFPCDLNGD